MGLIDVYEWNRNRDKNDVLHAYVLKNKLGHIDI